MGSGFPSPGEVHSQTQQFRSLKLPMVQGKILGSIGAKRPPESEPRNPDTARENVVG